jgi:hypothetical protein
VTNEWWAIVLGAIQGIVVIAAFLLAIFILFTVVVGAKKLRRRGPNGARSLEERVGQGQLARFLPPTAPRGRVDQLQTPELLEAAARRSS